MADERCLRRRPDVVGTAPHGSRGAAQGGGRSALVPASIDWSGMTRLGLGVLRLPPETFWSMTPNEFFLALEGAGLKSVGGLLAMDRGTLERMMADHPDDGPCPRKSE